VTGKASIFEEKSWGFLWRVWLMIQCFRVELQSVVFKLLIEC